VYNRGPQLQQSGTVLFCFAINCESTQLLMMMMAKRTLIYLSSYQKPLYRLRHLRESSAQLFSISAQLLLVCAQLFSVARSY
jgi:hypothetical protein